MSVTAPQGFRASGMAAGIKESGAPDLALVVTDPSGPFAAAATFTTNRAAAAPVQLSRTNLVATGGRCRAVVVNSGCANAVTGARGEAAARATAAAVGDALDVAHDAVLVCSTGLIGIHLPVDRVEAAVPALVSGLGSGREHAAAAAEAILTTDSHRKEVLVEGAGFSVGGMAKGAGMIAPNMATMLAVLTTDARVAPDSLATALGHAVAGSFNELTVDGCTSTNDTVVVLASGQGVTPGAGELEEALAAACADLAFQLAADAEGTTRVARVHLSGATHDADARLAARAVAESNLVKTSLYGADPYWGRVVSELGASGAAFVLDRVRVSYGQTLVFAAGDEVAHDRDAVARYLAAPVVEIFCDLGLGGGAATVLTTDLGPGYIEENMRTS
ncbi:MAG: bifunctional glutamate N-acetyltransferase/amino-acid acetyltransferase ArgJ [Actinomycetota bacterium]|nr:bifunctional glutamate N-acetyltransferase/amino-acid acetyltransferase ArgJ [Actinomycetota bacterium]